MVEEANLNEGSITAIPANPKAKIQRVASADGDKVVAEEEELDLETLKAMRDMDLELQADLALRSIRSAGSATLRNIADVTDHNR